MAQNGDSDQLCEQFFKAFTAQGFSVGRCEYRQGKAQILQYLQNNPSTDVIVLSEYQGNDGALTFSELDNYSVIAKEATIILIVEKSQKGGEFLQQLAANGIYNALYEDEASFETILELVKRPRDKSEGRVYYGINGASVSSASMAAHQSNNAAQYLANSNLTVEDLSERLSYLEQRISKTEILDVLRIVPAQTFEVISRIPQYQSMCQLIEEERGRSAAPEENKASFGPFGAKKVDDSKKKTKKTKAKKTKEKKNKKETPRTIIELPDGAPYSIAFIGTADGVGCTTHAILMAHSLAQTYPDARIAIYEVNSMDGHFEALCHQARDMSNVSGVTEFTMGSVNYYFHIPFRDFQRRYVNKFDYVIYDFGFCDEDTIAQVALGMESKFVVADANEWRSGEIVEFYHSINPHDIRSSIVYLFTCGDTSVMQKLEGLLHGNRVFATNYERCPYYPSEATRKLFVDILLGKDEQKWEKPRSLDERVGKKPSEPFPTWKLITLLSLILCVVSYTGAKMEGQNRYNQLLQQANSAVAERDQKIEELESAAAENENAAKEASDELAKYVRKVVFVTTKVPAGTPLTEENCEVRETIMDIDEKQLFTEDMIGQYIAAVDIYPNEMVHIGMVATLQQDEQTEESN